MNKKIEYTEKQISYSNSCYTVNLSSLLYFPGKEQRKSCYSKTLFELGNVIIPGNVVFIDDKSLKVEIDSDIIDLGKFFDCNFQNKSFSNINDYVDYSYQMYDEVNKLVINIKNFIRKRNKIFNKESITHISDFTKENNNELLELINALGKTIPTQRLEIVDYFEFEKKIIKCPSIFEVDGIYNYQSLQKLCKKIALQETEYYGEHYQEETAKSLKVSFQKKLLDETDPDIIMATEVGLNSINSILDDIKNTIDEINNSSLFTKETFALLYIMLEAFVEQEKQLEKFIKKILKTTNVVNM